MSEKITIQGPITGCTVEVEKVLRALPQWFGIEESLLEYVEAARSKPTFLALDGAVPVGFLMVERHFPESAEVYCVGILPTHHRRGIGRLLQVKVEEHLATDGVTLIQVKTIFPETDNEYYARTLAFYRTMGFVPLEVFPKLWQPSNPCLVLVKPLG